MIGDCCHSGTASDLTHIWMYDQAKQSLVCKHDRDSNTGRKNVLSISGCRDDQTSADATIEGKSQGALTNSLLRTFQDMQADSFWDINQLAKKLNNNISNFEQKPVISAEFCLSADCKDSKCLSNRCVESKTILDATINQIFDPIRNGKLQLSSSKPSKKSLTINYITPAAGYLRSMIGVDGYLYNINNNNFFHMKKY